MIDLLQGAIGCLITAFVNLRRGRGGAWWLAAISWAMFCACLWMRWDSGAFGATGAALRAIGMSVLSWAFVMLGRRDGIADGAAVAR